MFLQSSSFRQSFTPCWVPVTLVDKRVGPIYRWLCCQGRLPRKGDGSECHIVALRHLFHFYYTGIIGKKKCLLSFLSFLLAHVAYLMSYRQGDKTSLFSWDMIRVGFSPLNSNKLHFHLIQIKLHMLQRESSLKQVTSSLQDVCLWGSSVKNADLSTSLNLCIKTL